MPVLIPTVGSDTQLHSHALVSPKTLTHVAGHPILDYLPNPI